LFVLRKTIAFNLHQDSKKDGLFEWQLGHVANWRPGCWHSNYSITKSLNAFYNSCFAEEEIAAHFHPVRWALILAIAIPVVLGTLIVFARIGGNEHVARCSLRGLRVLLAAEFVLLFVLSCVGFVYEQRSQPREAALFHAPGTLVDMGGYRLHLYCTGSGGPTVVLEHGHRATYLDWSFVQPQIAKFARVCSYDRGGYGWSEPSPNRRVPSVMADELHSLLRAAGEKPPYILAGHSYGAMNTVMFAHKFPDEVAGLVLIDGSTPDSLPRTSLRTRLWMQIMQFTMRFGLPRWRGWCGGGPEEIAAERQALTCRSQNFETILLEDASFPEARNEIRSIPSLGNIPLVVITRDPEKGLNSALETKHNQQQHDLAKLSSNSRVVVAEGSAHDVPFARPEVIIDAVKNLATLPAPAGSQGTP
jgi:pimeloyl-ACP methyl ester carboxylesterase